MARNSRNGQLSSILQFQSPFSFTVTVTRHEGEGKWPTKLPGHTCSRLGEEMPSYCLQWTIGPSLTWACGASEVRGTGTIVRLVHQFACAPMFTGVRITRFTKISLYKLCSLKILHIILHQHHHTKQTGFDRPVDVCVCVCVCVFVCLCVCMRVVYVCVDVLL